MNIKLRIQKAAIETVKENIRKAAVEKMEKIALQIYNTIILSQHYPYWSGSYISSWNISIGRKDKSYNLEHVPDAFNIPSPKLDLGYPGLSFGQKIYITNYVPHAYKVEFKGTPLHPHEGWYTATYAVNQVTLQHKLV